MGPSGSGKSTAMNILGCLDTPTSGSYRFRGVAVETLTRDQRALLRRNYLGFVFQGFNLLNRTSALENVELPLIYRRTPRAERHALARAGPGPGRAHRLGGAHPGGTLRRPAAARRHRPGHRHRAPACCWRTSPPATSTRARSHEIMDILIGLNRDQGITVLMVTHEAEMAAYAGRIIHFRGRSGGRPRPGPDPGEQRLMLWNALLLALREIRRNVLRSFLTILGIVIGVAAVIVMVTLGDGATLAVTARSSPWAATC